MKKIHVKITNCKFPIWTRVSTRKVRRLLEGLFGTYNIEKNRRIIMLLLEVVIERNEASYFYFGSTLSRGSLDLTHRLNCKVIKGSRQIYYGDQTGECKPVIPYCELHQFRSRPQAYKYKAVEYKMM